MISEPDYGGQRPTRRWDRVSWWYCLVLVVPIIGFLLTSGFPSFGSEDGLTGIVRDAYSDKPVSGAEVSSAGSTVTTNGSGEFNIGAEDATSLSISRENYEPTQIPLTPGADNLEIQIRPTTLEGQVVNLRTGDPIAGATVVATGDGAATIKAVTDDDGNYVLVDVPRNASVSVEYNGFSGEAQQVGQSTEMDFEVRADVLTGVITDDAGTPLADATVHVGDVMATSGPDGTYRVEGVPVEGGVVVKKAGYREATADEIPDDMHFDAALTPWIVKSLYATALTVTNDDVWNGLLATADATEVNAIVVDLKDSSGQVFYDTKVQMVHDIGAVNPLFDVQALLEQMHEHDLYTIARIVVFEDPILAANRNDLAIHDSTTGGLWKTWDGLAWVNAHQREVWQYNIDLAVEAASLGFDEVQLDYIRFPTDGLLENADYGDEFGDETRSEAISGFLQQMQAALAPTGAYLAVDIFGFTLWEESDGGIGQQLESIEPYVDVICPMIYPSHFSPGEMGFDIPNDHPYEVILWSLQSGAERIGDKGHKLRPWLQDFSYGEGIEYGVAELQAQIQATEDFGASGWLVWNAANVYHTDAFDPQ